MTTERLIISKSTIAMSKRNDYEQNKQRDE